MYFIFKAPRWLEKTEKKTKLLSEKCRFCFNNEDVLHETNYFEIIKARYPYAPQHLIMIPKMHIPSLHFLNEEIFSDFLDLIKKTKKKDLCYMANYNYIAGQTLPHLHIHVVGELAKNEFKMKLQSPNLFYDPLSYPIICEAGLKAYINENGLVFYFEKLSQRDVSSIFTELECATKKIYEGKSKYHKITEYGMSYQRVKDLSFVYNVNFDEMNNIDYLIHERFGGFGINWHLNYVYGKYILSVVPRATILRMEDESIRWGALEMFYNAQLIREKFTEEEVKRWELQEKRFIELVLKNV